MSSQENGTNPLKQIQIFVLHLRLEAIALAILMVVLIYLSSAPLWILPASFLFFDIGMIGYIKNPKIGAITYNLTHNATLPTLAVAVGLLNNIQWLMVLGICWTFHIAVDRVLGYGLKEHRSFTHTHLGKIGKNNKK